MEIVTAGQMQELDRKTITDIGIPGIVLMENAGRSTYLLIKKYFPVTGKKIAVVCGKGNNGGDGFVIARYFLNEGFYPEVCLLAKMDQLQGDALINLNVYLKLGGQLTEITTAEQWAGYEKNIIHAGIIIDAMLGTGISSDVRGLYRDVIERINRMAGKIVVSVDIPSGIDASSGRVLAAAIKADLTCTFGLPKMGQILLPGCQYCGDLEIVDIGIPKAVVRDEGLKVYLSGETSLKGLVPKRGNDSHKGVFGHVFMLAGSPGKTGAAALAAQAAMRSGAGLVTVGIPRTLNSILEAKITEAMTAPLPDCGDGFLGSISLDMIREVLKGKTVAAIGPGISVHEETTELLYKLIKDLQIPMVIDADGLNIIAKKIDILKKIKAPAILTPHPGEMARLMNTSIRDIQDNRLERARQFARQYGVVVVLKGAKTIIAEPDGRAYINLTGNPGMASAGMGDVLTGIISALLAQGLCALDAARLGVFVHGRIADLIAEKKYSTGIIATDIIEKTPEVLEVFIAG